MDTHTCLWPELSLPYRLCHPTSTRVVPPEAACGGLLCVEDAIAVCRASKSLAWRHGEALRVTGRTLVAGDHDLSQKCLPRGVGKVPWQWLWVAAKYSH